MKKNRTRKDSKALGARKSTRTASRETKEKKIRIVLVDDHTLMRRGLAVMLQRYPGIEIIGEAADGESAVKLVYQLKPDVVLMDISMPVMDGIKATHIIHSELPGIAIIGLSMFPETELAAAMQAAGAVAYVCKTDPPDNLIAAIRASSQRRPEKQGQDT